MGIRTDVPLLFSISAFASSNDRKISGTQSLNIDNPIVNIKGIAAYTKIDLYKWEFLRIQAGRSKAAAQAVVISGDEAIDLRDERFWIDGDDHSPSTDTGPIRRNTFRMYFKARPTVKDVQMMVRTGSSRPSKPSDLGTLGANFDGDGLLATPAGWTALEPSSVLVAVDVNKEKADAAYLQGQRDELQLIRDNNLLPTSANNLYVTTRLITHYGPRYLMEYENYVTAVGNWSSVATLVPKG